MPDPDDTTVCVQVSIRGRGDPGPCIGQPGFMTGCRSSMYAASTSICKGMASRACLGAGVDGVSGSGEQDVELIQLDVFGALVPLRHSVSPGPVAVSFRAPEEIRFHRRA